MADLRGQELRDSYQNVLTRGTGATPIEDGNGSPYFYEEGTWTPIFTTSETGFTSVSYGSATGGRYIKMAGIVICTFRIRTDSIDKGSASGLVAVGNLPFAVQENSSRSASGTISESFSFLSNHPTSILPRDNQTEAQLSDVSMTGTVFITVDDLATGSNSNNIIGSLTYFV